MHFLIVYDYCKIARIFSRTDHIHKSTAAKHSANKVLFTFLEDAPIEYNNSCVYYKFSRFYGRPFVATLDDSTSALARQT